MDTPPTTTMTAAELRELRARSGLSTRQMARRVGHGLRYQYISRWEAGKPIPPYWAALIRACLEGTHPYGNGDGA